MAMLRRRISAVVFDLDGTLTLPGAIDFARMRERIRCPKASDILAHVEQSPAAERAALHAIIAEEEELGLARVQPMAGTTELFAHLRARTPRLLTGILTRNNASVMERTLRQLALPWSFDMELSRDWSGGPPKPHPAALLHMARQWGLHPSDCMMVGDSDDDILAGSAAGFTTVAIGRDAKALALAQHSIQSLAELVPILE